MMKLILKATPEHHPTVNVWGGFSYPDSSKEICWAGATLEEVRRDLNTLKGFTYEVDWDYLDAGDAGILVFLNDLEMMEFQGPLALKELDEFLKESGV